MRRPSSLVVPCAESARLGEAFPASTEAASRGTAIHAEIAAALNGGQDPASAEALEALRWLEVCGLRDGARAEVPLTLVDPESGETLTSGTADLVVRRRNTVEVVDWKTGRAENVQPVEENLQIWAYAAAAALAEGPEIETVTCRLVFLDGDKEPWVYEHTRTAAEIWDVIDAVRAEVRRAPGPNQGPWCESRCYQRHHCSAWMLPAHEGATALAPFSRPGGLTADNVVEAIRTLERLEGTVEAAAKAARAQLQDYVLAHGPIRDGEKEWGPAVTAGRKTGPSAKELEAAGLGHLVKLGSPITTWRWRASR